MRYILNISFKKEPLEHSPPIFEQFKTLREAKQYSTLIDETVSKALIKDTVTGKITWIKK